MKRPTIEEYEEVISQCLSVKQIEILQTLYYYPNSSATAKELAKSLNYASYHAANRQIGEIGKTISHYTGVIPPTYYDRNVEKPAYFVLVGEYLQGVGWVMWEEIREALKKLKLVDDNESGTVNRLPTETLQFEEKQYFNEGKVVQVYVNRYERNREARTACIQHYGNKCSVCGFDFGATYGEIAQGFIHVHHIKPLSEINDEYRVDHIKDLIPVCANCHSVIHMTKPAMAIEELKKRLKKSSR